MKYHVSYQRLDKIWHTYFIEDDNEPVATIDDNFVQIHPIEGRRYYIEINRKEIISWGLTEDKE